MLNAIHISHVFVFDQDEALDFYVGKLGLEVSNDQDLGFMRWLTVRVPWQPGRDILLEKPGPPAMDEASARQSHSNRAAESVSLRHSLTANLLARLPPR
jgi:catechol 2,3-dioxygenase-like lactoylglutathione lyase family enzyme